MKEVLFMFKKQCIAIVLCVALMFSFCCVETNALSEEELSSPSAVLIEPVTGKVLFEKIPGDFSDIFLFFP